MGMDDVEKAGDSKKIRAGKGKMRNRRYTMRRGPLIIYAKNDGIELGFRNLPGVELCCVDRLNLLQLAPGGHMGRFCVWSQAALEALDTIYGENGKNIPTANMTNADLARIINSDEIQSVLTLSSILWKAHTNLSLIHFDPSLHLRSLIVMLPTRDVWHNKPKRIVLPTRLNYWLRSVLHVPPRKPTRHKERHLWQ